MVRIHPDPPTAPGQRIVKWNGGAIAQLGERLLCKQEVIGSIPIGSTSSFRREARGPGGISNQYRKCAMLIGASS
jgi:hypothetical protein